jgi:hypothetical protein
MAKGKKDHAKRIAQYYEDAQRKARQLEVELAFAIGRNAPTSEIDKLKRLIEQARYVGD